MSEIKYTLLNLPNPPGQNIYREFAGGFGTTGSLGEGNNLAPQYLIYAASAMENEAASYSVIDAQALNLTIQNIIEELEKDPPEVLIAWLSLPSLDSDLHLLDEIKACFPATMIIALGTVCRVLSKEILDKSKIDALLIGNFPYYSPILSLIKEVDNGGVEALSSVPGFMRRQDDGQIPDQMILLEKDLDVLNYSVYSKLPVEKYLLDYQDRRFKTVKCIPILTGVGCPYSCSYCPYPLGYGSKTLNKSVEKVLLEIEFLIENYGIYGFAFREQAFTHSKKRVHSFCDEIIKRGLQIKWVCETRVDLVDREMLSKMKLAGCFAIFYGVETGDDELMKSIKKPVLSKNKVIETFRETKKAGIVAHAHMMIGFPDESWSTINNSIDFIKKFNPDHININVVTPYYGTKLREAVVEEGLLRSEDWGMYTSYEPVVKTKHLSEKDLIRARRKMKTEFYKFKFKTDARYRIVLLKKLIKKVFRQLHIIS